MRNALIGLLVGLGLAAAVAPAWACEYGKSASNDRTSAQQTAETGSTSRSGTN